MKQLKMKQKNKKFLAILLRTLAASVLGNALSGKGVLRACEGVIGAGQYF